MEENKRKHLEFLQLTITRMNVNSFLLKGWTITLIAALFALAAKDANANYVMIAYIVIPSFWTLDGYFLSIERRYRDLYNEVAKKTEADIDFDMNHTRFAKGDRTWVSGIFSSTLLIFYAVSVVTTLIVMYFLNK
jgi:hypothetical protein